MCIVPLERGQYFDIQGSKFSTHKKKKKCPSWWNNTVIIITSLSEILNLFAWSISSVGCHHLIAQCNLLDNPSCEIQQVGQTPPSVYMIAYMMAFVQTIGHTFQCFSFSGTTILMVRPNERMNQSRVGLATIMVIYCPALFLRSHERIPPWLCHLQLTEKFSCFSFLMGWQLTTSSLPTIWMVFCCCFFFFNFLI